MEKANMHSLDMVNENIKKIGNLFPECVTETVDENGNVKAAIDFEKLQENLSHATIGEGEERYQFTWPGKREAIHNANAPTNMTLRPCKEESVDFDNTENLYIEGDNLEVLKLLQENYLGKVKMIYIDPPYNTGNDFVYNDDFTVESSEFRAKSGMFDEDGNMLLQNFEKNTESNGRFHTDWLNMMYPRLKIARNLLSDDGVIFISIDDNEVQNLKKVCDEIFGEQNFVSNIVWQSTAGSNTGTDIVTVTENALVYTKNRTIFHFDGQLTDEESFSLSDEYESVRGKYSLDKLDRRRVGSHYSDALNFPITMPDGSIRYPGGTTNKSVEGWNYLWSSTKVQWGLKNGFIVFKKNENGEWAVYNKRYAKIDNEGKPVERSIPFRNLITSSQCNTAQGTKEIRELFESRPFDFPKPTSFLKQLLLTSVRSSKNSLILDFFSGSATTAHAVMQLNAEDGGKRKFICVQLPEATAEDSEAYKAGYKTICEIGKERIRRAGKKIVESLGLKVESPVTGEFCNFPQSGGKNGKLQGSQGLAVGNGSGGNDLLSGEKIATGGTVQSVGSNEAGSSLNSVEYCRGSSKEFKEGICPVSENSLGVKSGIGNAATDMHSGEISDRSRNTDNNGKIARSQQNADDFDSQIKGINQPSTNNSQLSTNNSQLSTNNSQLSTKLDIGFRVLKLASSNMKDVYYSPAETTSPDLFDPNNVKEDRTPLDLLFQVMPECNLPLSSKIEERTIEGKTVYFVNGNYLVACFDEGITEKLIKSVIDVPDSDKPYYFYMRNLGLESDKVLDNFEQLFVHYSPSTKRKVI